MSILTPRVFTLLALAVCVTVACSATAQAVDNTRYISITGNDANDCTLAAPCRNLPRGKNSTPAGGELRILDSGDYGNSGTVNKSLTISGNGNTVFLRNPIIIDNATAVVTLRGLTLNGQGTIDDGISIVAAAVVHIERCVVHNFTQHGIFANAEGVSVFVVDSVSRDNGLDGLRIQTAGSLAVNNSHFDNNGRYGAFVLSGLATIRSSTASGNVGSGIFADTSIGITSTKAAQNGRHGFVAGLNGVMTIESSVAHGNFLHGLQVDGLNGVEGLARISNSSFTDNGAGIENRGTVETRRNNIVRGNTPDIQGNALTFIGGI
jgi:hypothetical protein